MAELASLPALTDAELEELWAALGRSLTEYAFLLEHARSAEVRTRVTEHRAVAQSLRTAVAEARGLMRTAEAVQRLGATPEVEP